MIADVTIQFRLNTLQRLSVLMRALLDPRAVRAAFSDHVSGRDLAQGRTLFTIAMLELWLQAFSEVRIARPERVLVPA